MKITLLGTGTSHGVPVIACKCKVCQSDNPKDKRLRSAILIEADNTTIVVDTGPDFRQQMLREKVEKLDAVLFTHEHKDHLAGLDDVRAFNIIQKRPMDVYAEARVHETLKKEFAYVFSERKYPGVPEINLHHITEKKFHVGNIDITPIRVYHHLLPVLGFRIKNFVYLTDLNRIEDKETEKLEGVENIVVAALRKEKHVSHFNLEEALRFIEKINPKRAFLTHMSHQMGLFNEVEKELPGNVFLGYDGLVIEE